MNKRRVVLSLIAAVAVAAVVATDEPAHAGGSTTIIDASGVDYDATCQPRDQRPAPPPNSYASPGGVGCPIPGVSTYDGSTEATDIETVKLESVGTDLRATVKVGSLPGAGTAGITAADLPDATFTGARLRVMYQNRDKQTYGDNASGGCTDLSGFRVRDQRGHWGDGYHYVIGYAIDYDAITGHWVHRAEIGEYDPAPGGGFRMTDLGTHDGNGWTNADAAMAGRWWASAAPVTGGWEIVVNVSGIVLRTNPLCTTGVFAMDFGSTFPGPYSPSSYTGDHIRYVKGLSTVVRSRAPRPGATTCPPTSDDDCAGTGHDTAEDELVSDTTTGGSFAGGLGNNMVGVAYTQGEDDTLDATTTTSVCPTPTYGGRQLSNPVWAANQNQPCLIDDDWQIRGTQYAEFWDTPAAFVF